MGFTDPDAVVDDRPVVIFEAMEGLGQALAVARVLEKVARVGMACAYDRAALAGAIPLRRISAAGLTILPRLHL